MNPATMWWLEHTAQGRKVQRRIMPRSALGPLARRDAEEEQREEEARRARVEEERQRRGR